LRTTVVSYLHTLPTRRSSDLQRLLIAVRVAAIVPARLLDVGDIRLRVVEKPGRGRPGHSVGHGPIRDPAATVERRMGDEPARIGDRKSTRLNSSHLVISYAVL